MRDLGRVVRHLHHLGVAGAAGADLLVRRALLGAARVAGDHALHAAHLLVHGLQAPEAAAAQRRGLETARGDIGGRHVGHLL